MQNVSGPWAGALVHDKTAKSGNIRSDEGSVPTEALEVPVIQFHRIAGREKWGWEARK